MNPLLIFSCVSLLVAQFVLPRRLAFVPLLIATAHLPNAQVISSLTPVRLLVVAGLLRFFAAGGSVGFLRHPLDRVLTVWACWAVLVSFAHVAKENYNPLTMHTALAFDYVGTYLYARAYLGDRADFLRFSKCLAIVLLPLALFLLVEKLTGRNVYAVFGGVIEQAWVREGKIRASGPFAISILAGTAGGVCFPLIWILRRLDSRWAYAGLTACLVIVVCSASSGPLMSLFGGLAGLACWRWRTNMRLIRRGILFMLIGLHLIMKAPVWFLIARIDLAGGSTSYHRAELIDQALNRLNEWWLVGTDYTRHWMPYGIDWNADHVDMTNFYVKMGVVGGLPLMLSFIAILVKAFQLLGRKMQAVRKAKDPDEFLYWCVGSALFAHVCTFFGVSYFDQSYVFLCLVIGAVTGLSTATTKNVAEVTTSSKHDCPPLGESFDPVSNAPFGSADGKPFVG